MDGFGRGLAGAAVLLVFLAAAILPALYSLNH